MIETRKSLPLSSAEICALGSPESTAEALSAAQILLTVLSFLREKHQTAQDKTKCLFGSDFLDHREVGDFAQSDL